MDRSATPTTPSIVFLVLSALGVFPHMVEPQARNATPRETITVEVWAIDDRIIHEEIPPERRILDEARFTISGLIHGWSFVYRPPHPARGVDPLWELEPESVIPWGDPGLTLRAVTRQPNTLVGQVDYTLSPSDAVRRTFLASIETTRSAGVATAPLLDGLAGKRTSIESAMQDALRAHLRTIYRNRPREATGRVFLAEPPRVRTDAGRYEAHVEVLLVVEEVLPYLTD